MCNQDLEVTAVVKLDLTRQAIRVCWVKGQMTHSLHGWLHYACSARSIMALTCVYPVGFEPEHSV